MLGEAINRRAFLLGSAATVGVEAAEPWVRRAYSFLWSRSERPWHVFYVDTDMAVRHEVAVVGASGQWSLVTSAELDRTLQQILGAFPKRLAAKHRIAWEAAVPLR